MQPIEERLDMVRFKVDKTPHIRLNRETCKDCDTRACVYVCPAGLFELLGNEMHFSYEHCLECGTCYVACEEIGDGELYSLEEQEVQSAYQGALKCT